MAMDKTMTVWNKDILSTSFKTMDDHYDVYIQLFYVGFFIILKTTINFFFHHYYKENNINSAKHSTRYNTAYQEVLLKNPCPILEKHKMVPQNECRTFAGGSAAEVQ